MGGLHDGNFTPSLSWGYHAGAYYRNFTNSGLASLILGGYDASRINISSNLTLSPNDRFGPFYLDVESITIGGQNFLPQALTKVSLDSQVTSLWLPTDVCQKFEDAYGLTWNATWEMYFVNDSQHSALQQQNPNVTFTLSNGEPDSTVLLDITLPYAAFDLELMPPTADDVTTYYFPLKQATNADQYTLGRTIMQEIYMIANFENGTMSLFNVMYPTNASSADIVTICPNDSPNCALGHASSSTLSAGAIAGIVVGAVVVLLLIIGAVWYKWFRKPKYLPAPSNRDSGGTFGGADKAELDASTSMGSPRNELDGFYAPKPELDSGYGSPPTGTGSGSGSNPRDSRSVAGQQGGGGAEEAHEAGGAEVQEMSATLRRSDLPGNTNSGRYELYGSTPPAEGREG